MTNTAGGTIIYDSSVIEEIPEVEPGVSLVGVPFSQIAQSLGNPRLKNIVALGALHSCTHLLPKVSLFDEIQERFSGDEKIYAANEMAFAQGWEAGTIAFAEEDL